MSTSDTTTPNVVDSSNNKAVNMSRIRLEAIEKRKKRANDLIKARKRKLSELYFVNKSPFIPISDQKILEAEKTLQVFLEKNDLARGIRFDISNLPQQPVSRTPSTSTPSRNNTNNNTSTARQPAPVRAAPANRRQSSSVASTPSVKRMSPSIQQDVSAQHPGSSSPPQISPSLESAQQSSPQSQSQPSPLTKVEDEAQEPPKKIRKVEDTNTETVKQSEQSEDVPRSSSQNPSLSPVAQNIAPAQTEQQGGAPKFQEVYQIPPVPRDYVPAPTLSSLIQAYADSKPSELTEKEISLKKRELDISDIDINKLSVLLTPGNLPTQISESSPLAELYYLTQTCPLSKLIPTTHKALTTETYESALLEGKLAVVYSRIEELKRQKKWSLRQPARYHDPFVAHSSHKPHWNNLLEESKWMATDFKEGRKFKMVQCLFIAQAVSDYWTYGKVMCVKRKPIKFMGDENETDRMEIDEKQGGGKIDNSVEDEARSSEIKEEEEAEETPVEEEEEQPSEEPEEAEEEPNIDVSLLLQRPDPASEIPVPSLPQFTKEEIPQVAQPFKMYIDKSELSTLNNNIIDSLPAYEAFNSVVETKEPPIVAVSKLLTPLDENEDDWYKVSAKENYFFKGSSYATEKGLFGFSSTKRLTFIRPPLPPPLKYLDLRIPTIWLPEDDRHLIRYVAEFQFNWNIISTHLSAKPTRGYFSNIERRTPWQCFERYIQLNDKFQFSDMRGGYTPQAQMWLEAAHKAQSTAKRRISPLGVGNESIQRGHKRLRWASMFEAMRKFMKKRENVPKANTSSIKKDDKKISAPTPADLAKLKYERDKAIQEAYANQNTNVNIKRTASQQQQSQLAQQQQQQAQQQNGAGAAQLQSRSNSSNAQVQAVQRQLAAAAAVANSNNASNSSTAMSPQAQAAAQLQAQRLQKQRSSGSLNTGLPNNVGASAVGSSAAISPSTARANAILARSGVVPMAKGQLQAANAALAAQQQRLQQQQAAQARAAGTRSNSNPVGTVTGPNGQQYTTGQLQQLMQLQRQRNLQQQQLQSAPASTANSQGGTPVMAGATIANNNNLAATAASSPVMANANLKVPVSANGTPVKNFTTSFSNSQVTAIVQQIQSQHPHLNKQQVSRLAASYLHNLSTQQQQQQHRAMNAKAAGLKQSPSNPGTPVMQSAVPLADGQQQSQQQINTPQQGRNLASSLQMLNSDQLTKLANSPTLTANQRAQILSVQQQRLRNAGQTVMANNAGMNINNSRSGSQNARNSPIPTPQQLAAQRAKLQEQQQKQQQGEGDGR